MRYETKLRLAGLYFLFALYLPYFVIGPEFFMIERLDITYIDAATFLVFEIIYFIVDIKLIKEAQYKIIDILCSAINILYVVAIIIYIKKGINLGWLDRAY